MHPRRSLAFCCSLVLLLASARALAVPLQPGSLLVIEFGVVVSEYSSSGTLLQQILVPHPDEPVRQQSVHDLVARPDGTIALFNGTGNPRLTIWDPTTDQFEHHNLSGWSSVNCVTCGGIAALGSFVYAADQFTYTNGDAYSDAGIVRFDGASDQFVRFADGVEFSDLNIGLDGLLYALSDGAGLQVFDPITMDLLRTVSVSTLVKSIAVDADGTIYTGNFLGSVSRLAPDGTVLGSLQVSPNEGVTDIDLDASGRIVLALQTAGLRTTDTAFSFVQTPGIAGDYVGFAQAVPEPSALSLALGGLAFAAASRKRGGPPASPA